MSVTTHGGCWVVMRREIGSDMWQSLTPGLAAGEKRCDGRATSWSPDGTKVAFTREGSSAWAVQDLRHCARRWPKAGKATYVRAGEFHRPAFAVGRRTERSWPMTPGARSSATSFWTIRRPFCGSRSQIFPDGRREPFASSLVPTMSGLRSWDRSSGRATAPFWHSPRSSRCISDSHCETEIGSTYVVAAPGAATHRLTKRTSFGAWVQPGGHPASAWSPVGDSLLHVYCADFANEACRLETLHPGTGQRNALGKIGVYYGADTAWTPDGRSVLVFAAMFPQGPHKLRKVDRATGRAADLRSWPDPATVPDQLLAVTDSSVVLLTRLGLSDDGLTFRAVKLTTVPLDGGPPNSMTIMPPSGSRINDFDLLLMG